MNCEDFGRYLDNYENLTASEKSQMLEHAAMCEKCQAELDFFLSMIATTNSLPKIEPPADFMDSLNARLDAEDKRVVSASKIAYHIRRNWKQYTAAAACLALVTVITANRSMLLDRYVENDDGGVISEETVPADSTATPADAQPTAAPADTAPQEPNAAPVQTGTTPTAQATPAAFRQASTVAATSAPSSRRQSAASTQSTAPAAQPQVTEAAPAVQEQTAPSSEQTQASTEVQQSAPVQTETSGTKKASKSKKDDGYEIAHISDPTASVAYDIRAEDVKASLDASEVKANYSLADGEEQIAYGRYYTLDRNGNPISSASGIGSIKISSEDAELAMEIIDRYPHDESGNVYTTDSVNLTRILSKLKSEGVSFTDYTLGDTGEVKFKVIFN